MVRLDGSSLTIETILRVAEAYETVSLAPSAAERIHASRAVVDRAVEGDAAVYGVNTGFGSLADVRIARRDLSRLQTNLLRSHSAGVGEPLPAAAVRATMLLRANVLAKGYSGIRLETVELLIALLNARVHPVVPSRGSVGASGDLAPLAHLALVLIGEGSAELNGTLMDGARVLSAAGLQPVTLEPKEGLALVNGTQPSAAVLALAVAGAERLAAAADIAAALTIDGLQGSVKPFDSRIHEARPFAGQLASAANILALIDGSAINASHAHCGRVQDAYALRCAAQVHGAGRDAIAFARRTVEIESNAATDNPMVFADQEEILSGGNFHGAPVAIASDLLAIALAQFATISERRTDRLLNPAVSGLPPFLTREGGLQSGFMMAQVTAAALTSEIKTLAVPASIDTIPTSAGKEDHVSMGMGAALKASRALELALRVIAIEVMCGCQAIELLAPLTTSPALAGVIAEVRRSVPALDEDRVLSRDIERIAALIAGDRLRASCATEVK